MSESIRLTDGRRLAWHEFGASSGYPVIFCTGAGMSGGLAFAEKHLLELGLRLIAVDRPGLGDSEPHPTKSLDSWCRDTTELLTNIGVNEPPLVIGFSQGAPFALSLASAGMVKAVAIVSGQDDFSDPDVFALLPQEVADFVARVQQRDPALLDGLMRTADAEGFFNLILAMSSEKDRRLYDAEPFRSAYWACLAEGFRQGPGGYVQDLANALGRWPFSLAKITAPVDFWYGELDANAIHSPNFAATLSRRLSRHSRTLFAAEGGSILWTRSEEILVKLARHIGPSG